MQRIDPANTLQKALNTGLIITGGGAFGTHPELAVMGDDAIFNTDGLRVYEAAADAYINVGAGAISSYTFGPQHEQLSTRPKAEVFEARGRAYASASAVAAAADAVLVLAAVRPPADCYAPTKPRDYSFEERRAIAHAALEPLVAAGAQTFFFETFPSLVDARAALQAAGDLGVNSNNVVLSFYAEQVNGSRVSLPDGASLEKTVDFAGESNVGAIGLNCVPPGLAVAGIAQISQRWAGPIAVYPNGLHTPPSNGGTVQRLEASPEALRDRARAGQPEFLRAIDELLEVPNVALIGGCCFTDTGTIAAISKRVAAVNCQRQELRMGQR